MTAESSRPSKPDPLSPGGDTPPTAAEFLMSLTASFLAGDLERLAANYEEPIIVVEPGQNQVFNDPTGLQARAAAVRSFFLARGLADVRLVVHDAQTMGRELEMLGVTWHYLNTTGREIGARRSTYLLRRHGAQYKIAVHILHTEVHESQGSSQRALATPGLANQKAGDAQ